MMNPMRILVRLVLNWKFLEIISRCCATLSAIGCSEITYLFTHTHLFVYVTSKLDHMGPRNRQWDYNLREQLLWKSQSLPPKFPSRWRGRDTRRQNVSHRQIWGRVDRQHMHIYIYNTYTYIHIHIHTYIYIQYIYEYVYIYIWIQK